MTDVIKMAIDSLYEQNLAGSGGSAQRLLNSAFVGSCSGPVDGSEHYKHYVADYLDEKLANH